MPTEDDQTGGRSDKCACAKRGGSQRWGIGPYGPICLPPLATRLPPAPNDPRRMAASCQFGGRGARQRGVVASSDKILQQLHLRWGWGGGACDTRRRHVTHDMQTLSLHHAFIVEATLQLCYQDITDGLVDTDVASCVALYCGGNLYWRFALALLRVVRLSETLFVCRIVCRASNQTEVMLRRS